MRAGFDTNVMGQISGFIAERMGLHFPEERWPDLARTLTKIDRNLDLENPDSVARWITTGYHDSRHIELLASHLTVGETYFFRDPASFELLERELLPAIIAKRVQHSRTLRLWSAGCCTGEEAYSLAITCSRAIPDLLDWNISILATDINPTFLTKAEAGVYSKWSFRGAPAWLRERFMSPSPGGTFTIDPAIKTLVHFSYLNLALDSYPALHNQTNAMDVIFCRNILMYFTQEHQQKVVAALYRCLVDGGYLFVNPAEANPALFPMFSMENHGGVILFRKTSQPAHSVVWPLVESPYPIAAPPAIEPAVFIDPTFPAPLLDSSFDTPVASFIPSPPIVPEETVDAPVATITHGESERAPGPLAYARICADQGRLDEALLWCQQATAVESTNLAAQFLCATIYSEIGRPQDAIAAFSKVLYLDQDFILAHHALGVIYKRLGNRKESGRHLSVALKLLLSRNEDEVLPESEGITCGRLVESVRSMKGV